MSQHDLPLGAVDQTGSGSRAMLRDDRRRTIEVAPEENAAVTRRLRSDIRSTSCPLHGTSTDLHDDRKDCPALAKLIGATLSEQNRALSDFLH